ncbi:hypothetical protein M409DRAFT_49851 [Zasmidium cellare ATCC 36951]|uniref:DUF7730 domain-containing protein n=1 Tax=Zasmidium cellare ATCC 36951 TaxID=1080233 RepID=A0A6A6CZD6_ZASCE|nr:uncharacterized protein M409DRAFT_49851 [Zasmidium cellare ATCC 36951]KAF2172103.1 hypothetical protein M409DRAFT_49851 [Zasmidium cellare ATCC 36951]
MAREAILYLARILDLDHHIDSPYPILVNMGRRKARWRSSTTAPSTSDAKMEDSPILWQTSVMSKTDNIPTKKSVARARAKHKDDNSPKPEPPSLADRFHALPSELRAHIFSLLLVQPVKWDISHQPTCILRRCDIDQTPRRPWVHPSDSATCVYCDDPSPSRWRRDVRLGLNIWTNPWRSHWAPPQRNPYLCSQCYDLFHNPQPVPRAESLPCLCARRANLSTLLVCRQWYTEAATVFYSQNTFAFEHPALFTAFLTNLPPHWQSKISKLSLMAFSTHSPGAIDVDSAYADPTIHITPKRWLDVWPLLRKSLPALSTLELDSSLLRHPKTSASSNGPDEPVSCIPSGKTARRKSGPRWRAGR